MQPVTTEGAAEQRPGPIRRRTVTLMVLGLLITVTALVAVFVAFVDPATGAAGGCGG